MLVPGPLKLAQRCRDKIAADYEGKAPWPPAASLFDIVRCAIAFDDPYAMAVLIAYFQKRFEVVRIKNRFGAPTASGWCDIMVNITLRVLSKPDTAHLPQIYRELGTDYDERVLPSIVNEVLKAVVARLTALKQRAAAGRSAAVAGCCSTARAMPKASACGRMSATPRFAYAAETSLDPSTSG